MNLPNSVACLSLASNLRCVPLNFTQFNVLIIPPTIELVFCASLIFLKLGSSRTHLLLATDGVFYFILALIDLLSHTTAAARNSIATFKATDIFVGSVSFVPMLLYTSYLFCLSYGEFIPGLPSRYRSVLKYLLMALIPVIAITGEVASFVGVSIRLLPNSYDSLSFDFTNNSESLWIYLSRLSLALYATIQILFFFLAFHHLSKTIRNRQRIDTTLADEHHRFNGVGWVTIGIQLGVIETIVGFATGGFAVPLSRRILRLMARGSLIIGVLKGMDTRENFEYLVPWRRTMPLPLVVNQHMSNRTPKIPEKLQELSPSGTGQRVTVVCERGRAPFLQIRFSKFNFLEQAIVADGSGAQSPRRSSCDYFARMMHPGHNSSAPIHHDDVRPFVGNNTLRDSGSGYTVSDSMSVIRELSRRFPLPPRVTGKYRGSILGQGPEEVNVELPLVGVPRESSMRRGTAQGAAAGTETGTKAFSTSGSIKRKPVPPLLHIPQPVHIAVERAASSYGGPDTPNIIEYTPQFHTTPTIPKPSIDSPSSANMGDSTSQLWLRQLTPRRLFHRTSRALSTASIRSAEWLSSSRSKQSSHPQLTLADIEAYYNGGAVSSPQRARANHDDMPASASGGEFLGEDQFRSTGDAASSPGTPQSQIITHVSVRRVRTQTTPTPTFARFPRGREPITSTYGEVQGWSEIKESATSGPSPH